MRLGFYEGLPGPFYLAGTLWRSKPRRRYRATLGTWTCSHAHRSETAALRCANRRAWAHR